VLFGKVNRKVGYMVKTSSQIADEVLWELNKQALFRPKPKNYVSPQQLESNYAAKQKELSALGTVANPPKVRHLPARES
jgi:hypothetical protein